ncbi:non-homologous end-joining DNA ligase [Nocardioides sp. Kera G14]|uniref:non-homologous end-joining DNA ligase n=1 Tax=Nocardioides sp. Kera G14 TaxID=2884264 RepID=UPI001D114A1E|nr:non-homologous end-joining DNA ligase [Nocardioides sp. Kera G14]UDY24641.1 non-homologous end-joining DNA ligase [Nocardioides sp. Kera G14]
MLATAGTLEGLGAQEHWAFEMKWDGVRALVHLDDGAVRLVSRNGNDMSTAYPELTDLADAVVGRTPGPTVLDGEIVSFDADGRPSFARLQKRMHVGNAGAAARLAASEPVVLLLFDVLVLGGESLLAEPYTERRLRLEGLDLAGPAWQTPAAFVGSGDEALATSQQHRLEGVVAKRLSSNYQPGRRSADWIKIKNIRTQEVIVGGWTLGQGARGGKIGALLLGLPDGPRLRYVGKVGTGFTASMLQHLASDLAPLEAVDSPFVEVPRADARGAHWVTPTLVGEVTFTEWTRDGRLRHPSWRGLRPDKRPDQVAPES